MIGIIGFGRMGRCLKTFFKKGQSVKVFDNDSSLSTHNIEEVCKEKYIFVCVPIRKFENCIKTVSKLVDKSTTVIDVCSVKEYPLKIMKKHLECKFINTHPLFGPSNTHKIKEIIVCNESKNNSKSTTMKSLIIKQLFGKNVTISEMSHTKHDKMIAYSLVLAHFIGRSIDKFKTPEFGKNIGSVEHLMALKNFVMEDSKELFVDMNRFNPYTRKMREQFIKTAQKLNKVIE